MGDLILEKAANGELLDQYFLIASRTSPGVIGSTAKRASELVSTVLWKIEPWN